MFVFKQNYFSIGLIICIGLQSSVLVAQPLHGMKKAARWEGPVPLSMFKKKVRAAQALSASDLSALSTALASTSANAGTNALSMITDIAQSQSTLLQAIYVVCTALTTVDAAHGNATPISLATAAVKKALSVGVIVSLNENYNFTLLHYAGLFSSFGGVLNTTADVKTPAATIISALLGGLTNAEQQAAITAKDMWDATPLHYVMFSPAVSQLAVVNAMMPTAAIKNATLSAVDIYERTPVHYAATFITSTAAKNVIKAIFNGLTAAQKIAAFGAKDQWDSTPLHYAALYKNVGVFDKTLFAGITAAQRLALFQIANAWGALPTHCATYDSKAVVLDQVIHQLSLSEMTPSAGLSFAVPTPALEIATVLVPNLALLQ